MQPETEARAIEAFRKRPRVLRLECGVQHYDWGDPDAIPTILGRPNPHRKPFAELWAGAHPDLSSQAIIEGIRVSLGRLVREAPKEILGAELTARFQGELPFLLKILAAAEPLSIQAHPNRAQAQRGFEHENLEGIPLHSTARNYRDQNHKPELLVALSEFYALHGFRPLAEIEQTLAHTPELAPLVRNGLTNSQGLAAIYEHIKRLGQSGLNALLMPLVERLEREDHQRAFSPRERAFWVLRAHRVFSTPGRLDRGLFSILLLNLVHLHPGQGIFLPAGELHSYLQGVGIEIMANSNNVLRGGLTTKHVDPGNLLRVLTFRAGPTELVEPQANPDEPCLWEYRTPAAEFALSRLALDTGQEWVLLPGGMRLALLAQGDVDVAADDRCQFSVCQGEALLVPSGLGCRISAADGAQLWLARVPEAGTDPDAPSIPLES